MYTSQEGELYVGQARALGAMGVLPKQVRPVDVSKVLYELHLLPDRRDLTEPALVPVEVGSVHQPDRAAASPPISMPPDWGRRIEAAVKQQSVDLRRFIVASLDSFSSRFEADLRRAVPTPAAAPAPEPAAAAPERSAIWPWALGTVALCILGGLCALVWSSTRDDLARTRAELAALKSSNTDLQQASDRLAATVKDLAAAVTASTTTNPAPAAGPAGLPRSEPVPYGELPFDRSRLEILRDVLTKLEAQSFRGVVRVTSVPGLFCLSGNSADGFTPAAAGLPASKCDMVGNPFEESLTGQQRQSIAFANLVAGVRQRTGGAITVVFETATPPHAATPYPLRNDSVSAGEWNRAATANNRVEFAAEPGPSP